MAKNILVTGAAGKMGSIVCPHLRDKGYNVTGFDRVRRAPFGNAEDAVPYVYGDLTSLSDCMRAIAHAQPDVIVHLGAIPYNTEIQPRYSREWTWSSDGARFYQGMDEDETMRVNTMGTYYLLDAARRMGIKDIIAASTYFVLGIGFRIDGSSFVPEYLPIDEDHPCLPQDTYSLSKWLNEETMKAYCRAYGMRCIAMRLLGVYYDGDEFSKNVHKTNITVPEPKPDEVDMLISNVYQYVDGRDVAYFIEKALVAEGLGPFEAFYLATDTVYNEDTADVIKKRWPSFAAKGLGAGIKGTDGLISIEKARRLIGYEPQYSWRK